MNFDVMSMFGPQARNRLLQPFEPVGSTNMLVRPVRPPQEDEMDIGVVDVPTPVQPSGAPSGAASQDEIRTGSDGQNYQYAQTSGSPDGGGDWGWIRTSMQPQPSMGTQPVQTASAQPMQTATDAMPTGSTEAPQGGFLSNLGERFTGFRDGDRGRYLADMFSGWAMGQTPGQSLGYGAAMANQGRQKRGDQNQTMAWLRSQGLDEGEARLLLGNQSALSQFLKNRLGGATEAPAAFQTLDMRARAAGFEPGTEGYRQFMAQGGGGSQGDSAYTLSPGQIRFDAQGNPIAAVPEREQRDRESEARVQALMARGISREEAEDNVYGFNQVVVDPVLQSPMRVNRVTGEAEPLTPNFGGEQASEGPTPPPPGGSLYDLAEVATGAVPGIQERWTGIAPQFGLPGVDGVTESRQVMRAASRDLIRALSINPRFPVGEMQAIEREIDISPGVLSSPQSLQERMRGVDSVLRRRLANEQRTANNPNLPAETRRNALQASNDIENFLVTLGVPQQTQGQGQQPQPQQSGPQPGAIEDGFRFRGGDPADPANWERAQ